MFLQRTIPSLTKIIVMGYQDHLFAGISLGLSRYGFPLECIDSALHGDPHCRRYKASLAVSSIHPRYVPCCVDVYCDTLFPQGSESEDVALLTGVHVGISWGGATLLLYEIPVDIEWCYFVSALGGDLWAATQMRTLLEVRSYLELHLPGIIRHVSSYMPTTVYSLHDMVYVCRSVSGEFSECCEFTPMQVVGVPCYENGDDMDMCTVRDSTGAVHTLRVLDAFCLVDTLGIG
jgi:hypothetical protein